MEELDDLDKDIFPVVARVDFIDRILGDELLNIIAEWSKSLRDSSIRRSPFILLMKKNKAKILTFLNFFTNILTLYVELLL